MSGNYFCHVCGGLVDLIKLQPSDVRLCECEKRFARLRAENEKLTKQVRSYVALVKSMEETKSILLRNTHNLAESVATLESEREAIGSSKNAVNSTLKNVLLPQGYVERRKLSERRFEYRWLGKAFEGKRSKPIPPFPDIRLIQEATIRKCAAHAAKVINQQGPFICNIHDEILSLIKEL